MAHTDTEFDIKASSAPSKSFHQLSSRFPEPLECLTAHLLLESSEVLGGVKPANLVSLVNRTRSCGRNLHQLWQSHHDVILSRLAGLCFKVLQSRENAILLFCYKPDYLERHLAHHGIRTLLSKAGYDTTQSSEDLLAELCHRIGTTGSFPHEIGLFIGYPAKDVAAFMGMVKLPFTCQGPWKIYGNPTQSLCLADAHRRSRVAMGTQLAQCTSPFDCLEKIGDTSALFFHSVGDKDYHFHKVGL